MSMPRNKAATAQSDNPDPTDTATDADVAGTVDAEVQRYGTAATGTVFDHLPDDLQIAPPAPVTRFSIEHWLHLARVHDTKIPPAPVQLAPFPAALHSDTELREQLVDWGYVEQGEPTAALIEMLSAIANPEVMFWGQVRFPGQAFTTRLDLPPEAIGWGIDAEQEVVPRTPFLIAWNTDVVYLVTSHEEGLVVAAAQPSTDDPTNRAAIGRDLAIAWGAILDPAGQWPSAPIGCTRLPRGLLDEMAGSPLLGYRPDVVGPEAARNVVDHLIASDPGQRFAAHKDHARRVVELIVCDEVAAAQGLVSARSARKGETVTSGNAVSLRLINTSENESQSYLVSPEKWGRDDIVVFDRSDAETVAKSIAGLIEVTSR